MTVVKKQIGELVSGLIAEALYGSGLLRLDDWECRLADRAHAIVSSHMSRVEEGGLSDMNGIAMVRHPTKLLNMWLNNPILKPQGFALMFDALHHEAFFKEEQILSDGDLIEHLAKEIRHQMEKHIEEQP